MKDSPYLAETSASAQPAAHAVGYHGDDRWLLLWATLIGVLGALATVAFHEGMTFAESLATGHAGRAKGSHPSLPQDTFAFSLQGVIRQGDDVDRRLPRAR
jgi:hypothetical protein